MFSGSNTATLGVYSGMTDQSSIWNGAKFRCAVESNGATVFSSPATLTVVLQLPAEISSSSSSSKTGNIFLDNISLFRQYSLDASLVELYFNKGTNSEFVDLNVSSVAQSSSSSSEDFSIVIELEGDEGMFGEPYQFPEDMEFYFYDEKANGIYSPGIFLAEKVNGQNKAIVRLAPSTSSSSSSSIEYEFQINIEHPRLMPIRKTFRFSKKTRYAHPASTTTRIKNSTGRVLPSYISLLISWITDFWSAYDMGDASLIPELPRPPANQNSEFDPFEHARWKLRSELNLLGSLDLAELQPGWGWRTIRGWNFLGVSASVWDCITKPGRPDGLYSIYYAPGKEFDDWVAGKGTRPNQLDKSFDCRSFTAASAYALKDQLSSQCFVSVKYRKVGQDDSTHALLFVEFDGCKEPDPTPEDPNKIKKVACECCSGSFMFEPQTGATFKSVDDYCKKNEELCKDKSQWKDQEIEDADFSNLNWENDPVEMERIKNVICGCLTGTYSPESAENMIKDRCSVATSFKNWFRSNFSFEPGKSTSPMFGMPSILSCKKVVCEKGRSPALTGPMCTQEAAEGEEGVTPYQCKTQCQEKWSCYNFECMEAYTLNGVVGDYEIKDACLDECSNDKVCVHSWHIRYNCESKQWERFFEGKSTVSCLARSRYSTSSDWVADPEICSARTFDFVTESSCEDQSTCLPGIPYDNSSAPIEVRNTPSEAPPNCCGSWCELEEGNVYNLTGNCKAGTLGQWSYYNSRDLATGFRLNAPCLPGDCQDKVKSFYLYDQWPEYGNNPFG